MDTISLQNIAAARALAEAGADMNAEESVLARKALRRHLGEYLVPFTDFSPGIPYLKIYAEHGGDLNAVAKRVAHSSLLEIAKSRDNLEGILFLLEAGADPWNGPVNDRGFQARGFYEALVSTTLESVRAELFFRVVLSGQLSEEPGEKVQPLLDEVEEMIASQIDIPGPREQGSAWRLQHIAKALIDHSAAVPSDNLTRLLARPVPDESGGWALRPDQLHVDRDFPAGEIKAGTLIWPVEPAEGTPEQ